MKTYIGTKIIKAIPMTRIEMIDYRGWTLPADEDGADDGYLVEYTDGGKANDPRHVGYISWSPKDVFAAAYREMNGMTFGMALELLKLGKRVARTGWNGKGMWLSIAEGWNARLGAAMPDGWLGYHSFITIYNMDKLLVPWAPSQSDMLAEDWQVLS